MVEFVMSYERDDGADDYVKEFFDELCAELARRRPVWDRTTVGYLDTSMRTGSDWKLRLGNAMSTARVLVPLYSPRFFASDWCGREWAAFGARTAAYEAGGPARPELVVPVLWEPCQDSLPGFAAAYQYTDDGFPGVYTEKGLRRVVRLRNHYAVAYDEIVNALADRIIQAYDEHPMPPADRPVDWATVRNAFLDEEPVAAAVAVPGTAGHRHVHFVMAAATASEIAAERPRPQGYYGHGYAEWNPYHPVSHPIVLDAIAVAMQMSPPLIPEHQKVSGDLVQLIRDAEQTNAIVVLLVDAWTLRLPQFREALEPYDRTLSLHTAVVVPTNGADEETAAALPVLQDEARALFTRNFRGRREFYRDEVQTVADFRRELGEVLVRTQALVFETSPNVRQVAPGHAVARPTISGPGGV